MLISALCSYYDTLAANGVFEDESLVEQEVSYMIFLSPDGAVVDIVDYTKEVQVNTKKGTKTQLEKRKIKVPYHPDTSSVVAYLLDYRSEYIFGFAKKDSKKLREGESHFFFYAKKHDAFVKTNLDFIEGVNSSIVNAYRKFLQNWKPPEQVEGTIYQQVIGSCCCFALEGHPDIQLQNDSFLLKKCRERFQNRTYEGTIGTCAITGLAGQPIARTHGKIKGLSSGKGKGNCLVCFNNPSDESYGKKQSANSSISAVAAEKYVGALNWLLRTDGHHTNLDNMTLVYWADTENADADKAVCDVFDWCIDEKADREETDSRLSSFMAKMRVGELSASDLSAEGIDPSVSFYVAGLYSEESSSRISVKFVYRNSVGKFADNIAQHQRDIWHSGIEDRKMYLGLLVKQLFSPKTTDKNKNPSYPMYAAMLESILNGTRYPGSLLSTMVLRCRTDSNDKEKHFYAVNARRIALIKACLNRQARIMNKQEVIPMALDTENNSQAYVCGRLFALLEYAQKCANQKNSQKDLNRTIKDSYFSSACTRPAVVFPRLMMLAQHHLEKAENGGYINGLIRESIDMLEGKFPSTLSLDEQGEFIVGYYQQNKKLYAKKEEN